MASTYENDLRLQEIGTGEQSGTWGTTTNTNLELVGEALSYSATGEAIANASTHTITVADGVADEARCFYLKCTGGGQACTVTLAPNSLSKVWVIENTTSYTLTFSQGSGANVAILAGQVKMIATDGAGSGAAVFDTMQDLAVPDLFVDDDITLQSDAAVLGFGVDKDVTLTHVADTGLLLNAAMKVQFRDSAIFIGSSGADVLDIASDGVINLTATSDVVIPANVGLTFGTGEKIEGDSTDLTITSGAKINLTATSDVVIPANIGLTFGTGEKIEGDSTDLTVTSGADINLTATADVNIPSGVGLTFGNDGEKIEGDGTDLTIAGNNINLTAVADIVVPANVGITFGTGEKIEGDSTDLTITSGAKINLTATSDIVVPANVGITFGTGEKIEGDSTDLTITSGAKINLTATSDVHIPNAVGLVFGDGGEHIETDNTNLTITSGGNVIVAATTLDVNGALDVSGQATATGFTGTLDGILGSGSAAAATVTTLDTSGAVNLNLTTDSTSSTSGALIVDGGVGVAKKLYVGTDLDVNGTANLDIVDIDGAVDMATTLAVAGTSTFGGGTTIDNAGVLTLEAGGNLTTAGGSDLNIVYPVNRSLFIKEAGTTAVTIDNAQLVTLAGGLNVVGSLDVATNAVIDGTALVTGVLTTTAATVFNGGFASNAASGISRTHSTTNSSLQILDLKATSSGNMADGFGPSIHFSAADGGATSNQVAEINAVRAGSDTAFNLELQTADTTRMTIGSGGVDIVGALDISTNAVIDGTALVTGVLTTTAATVFNGGTQSNGTVTVGVDDTGYDVKFFGAAASAYMLWDASIDDLILGGAAKMGIGETAPANLLHVKASDTGIVPHASAQIVLEREGTNYLQFLTAEAGTSGILFGDGSDVDVGKIVYDHNIPSMQFHVETGLAMTIDTSGNATFAGIVGINKAVNSVVALSVGADSTATNSYGLEVTNASGATRFLVDGVGSSFFYKTDNNVGLKFNAADGSLSTPTLGASNVRFGVNAGNSILLNGNYNTVVGDEAGTAITISSYSTGLGYKALFSNVLGSKSTAVGGFALYSQNPAGSTAVEMLNTAVGYDAGNGLTTGTKNTFIGALSGDAIVTGSENVAVGYVALTDLTSGTGNVAVGEECGSNITTGSSNVAMGKLALFTNISGGNNVAIGQEALRLNTGSNNLAIGYRALKNNAGGVTNVAIGHEAMLTNVDGDGNTAVGHEALKTMEPADGLSYNTAVGLSAGKLVTTGTVNTYLGGLAGSANQVGHNNVALGFNALLTDSHGSQSVAVGVGALQVQDNGTTATNFLNTAVGYNAGVAVSTGVQNTLIGANAGDSLQIGNYNTAVGKGAFQNDQDTSANTAIGFKTLHNMNGGNAGNTAVGSEAGYTLTNASGLVAIGHQASYSGAGADGVTAVGYNAGKYQTTAGNSTFIGHLAGQGVAAGTGAGLLTGDNNTAVGKSAGLLLQGAGNRNTLIGAYAGDSITTPVDNICIGYEAGSYTNNLTTGTQNILIGAFARSSAATVDSEIAIGRYVLGQGTLTATLGVSGNGATISIDGSDTSWAAHSDERLKENITTSTAGLSFINDLRPVTYTWKAKNAISDSFVNYYDADSTDPINGVAGKTYHGFVAQEMKTTIDAHSEVANGNNLWAERVDDIQQLAPSNLIPMLTKAVQELSTALDAALARIATLEG